MNTVIMNTYNVLHLPSFTVWTCF